MPRWYCPQCQTECSSSHHYVGHLKGWKNAECKRLYDREHPTVPIGKYDPNKRGRWEPEPNLEPLIEPQPIAREAELEEDPGVLDKTEELFTEEEDY